MDSQNHQLVSAVPLSGLPAEFRRRAIELRQWASADHEAHVYDVVADELETALRATDDAVLSIPVAAAESGYHPEHLRRILREQPHLNCGRRGKPAIRRRDLPQKPGNVARRGADAYDVIADARSLLSH